MTTSTTFRQFESPEDKELVDRSGDSPLETWYRSVRDKPIREFTDDDLGIALRQQLFPEIVIPKALELLSVDPLAGYKYDGEILRAMTQVERDYWVSHRLERQKLAEIARSNMTELDDETAAMMTELLRSFDALN